MIDINIKDIKELFSQSDMIIGDVDINEEENVVNVYIEASSTGTYTIYGIETIVKKIKDIRTILAEEMLIEDITFGDLYKGIWRVLIHFKDE